MLLELFIGVGAVFDAVVNSLLLDRLTILEKRLEEDEKNKKRPKPNYVLIIESSPDEPPP